MDAKLVAMTKVEEVARAIAESRIYGGYSREVKEMEWLRNRGILMSEARRAIEVLREPTAAMQAAVHLRPGEQWQAAKAWQQMIDAILAEHQAGGTP